MEQRCVRTEDEEETCQAQVSLRGTGSPRQAQLMFLAGQLEAGVPGRMALGMGGGREEHRLWLASGQPQQRQLGLTSLE